MKAKKKHQGVTVLVCGGRDYTDQEHIWAVLDDIHETTPIAWILHGGASGADTLAGRWAQARGVSCRVFYADWQTHGRVAGMRRNQRMLDEGRPDLVVAFPGGRGTRDMIQRAYAAGVPIRQELGRRVPENRQ